MYADLDHETTPTITVTVTASDGTNSTSAVLVITVTDVDEAPVFINLPVGVDVWENSTGGGVVYAPMAIDPEGATVSYSAVTWSPATAPFSLTAGRNIHYLFIS